MTPFFRWAFVSIMALFGFLFVLFLLSDTANAETPCGVGGTAKGSGGKLVTRTDEEATAQQIRIGADGYWWTCPKTEYVPPPQPPKNCLPSDQGFRTWTATGNTCTTYSKYASSADDPSRNAIILHGQTKMWRQWQGPYRGHLIERCIDGVRSQVTAFCSPVSHCDVKWSFNDGKSVYSYDARRNKVPLGLTVQATSPDGKAIPIKCVAGNFTRVR